jgi:hypothetical protein
MITKTGKVNGGRRLGAGRPKGSVNRDRAEQRRITERLLEEGLTPLDIMKARMLRPPLSNGMLVTDDQFAAACALAPYVGPDRGPTPSIRALLQEALGAEPQVDRGVAEETGLFPKDAAGGRPARE